MSHDQRVCTWLSGGRMVLWIVHPVRLRGPQRSAPHMAPRPGLSSALPTVDGMSAPTSEITGSVHAEALGRPARAHRPPRCGVPRGAGSGGRRPGRALGAGARRPAHRLGQVGRLLRLDRAAAPPRQGPDLARQPTARPHARPGGRRGPGRHPRGGDLQRQHDRVGRHRGPPGCRRRRRPARLAGAADQPALPRGAAARAGRTAAAWWSSTRRTASPTGATTSVPTTAASATCSARCPPAHRCWRPPPRRTSGWWPTSPSSSVPVASR